MIYISCPYTHPDPSVQEYRYKMSCKAASKLFAAGIVCFNPLAHSVPAVEFGGCSLTHSQWLAIDLEILRRCDEMLLLGLEGWRQSVGVKDELFEALALGKPVTLIEEADIEALPFIPKHARHFLKSRFLKEVFDGNEKS